ncbi:MAG: PIN domain-containing protein [Candidatus Micrarchaeota archaeon]|nr:PIN domain-containing protein [Candidatus Micrarchaeota archaeon]
MPYADTDFFVALAKSEDRLHQSAVRIYEKYQGEIYTSLATILELSIIATKLGKRVEELMEGVLGIAEVKGIDRTKIMLAARLIENSDMSTFDAFHAALCEGKIISSDHIYDKIGVERIQL